MVLSARAVWWILSMLLALVAALESMVPLFSLLDYEGSLVLAFFAALLYAPASAIATVEQPSLSYWNVLVGATWFVAPAFVVKVLGARVWGQCSWGEGLAFFVMYPLLSAVVAGAVGFLSGSLLRSGLWAAIAALGIVVASLAINLAELYFEPVVYSYDPFYGYFSGAFYDTAVEISAPFLWSRAHDLMIAASAVALAYALRHGASWWPAAVVASAAVIMTASEPSLGFATTWASLNRHLPVYARSGRVVLHADPSIPEARRAVLFKEILFHYRELKEFFHGEPPSLNVYLFRSSIQKRQLFGAENVEIAKPWQNAVFITDTASFPHRTLRHEMAHVFAGIHGDTLFRISFTGILPNPGLIEGMAVAASFATDHGDYHQMAAELVRKKPSLSFSRVFGPGFYSMPSSQAYVAAGSFMRYLYDELGPEKVFRLYRTGRFSVLERDPEELWNSWKSFLKERIRVPPVVAADAAARFDRPPLHRIPCLHEVARRVRRMYLLWDDRNREQARRVLEDALRSLPHVHFLLTACLTVGDSPTALRCARELSARQEPHLRALGLLELAYDAARHSLFDRAREILAQVGGVPSGLHRRAELLRWALSDTAGRRILTVLDARSSPIEAARRLKALGHPMALYLAGSIFLAQGDYAGAVAAFRRVDPGALLDDEFRCAFVHRAVSAGVFHGDVAWALGVLERVRCLRSSAWDAMIRRELEEFLAQAGRR